MTMGSSYFAAGGEVGDQDDDMIRLIIIWATFFSKSDEYKYL
jgi:hypothetical protein